MVEDAATNRPSAEARRQQILDAACARVRTSGFHGASMADIAKTAGLSVGQIYRYFENKEAMVAAMVEQDLAEMREKFAEFESAPGDLLDAISAHMPEAVERCYDPDRGALVLEVLAEAARNPKVAAIVRAADAEERVLGRQLLERSRKSEWSDHEFEARAEVLAAVFDGMVVRAVNNPDVDRVAMAQVVRKVVERILS